MSSQLLDQSPKAGLSSTLLTTSSAYTGVFGLGFRGNWNIVCSKQKSASSAFESPFDPLDQSFRPLRLALPNHDRHPAEKAKMPLNSAIASLVTAEFILPIFMIRFWHGRLITPAMPVPKAAVDQNNCLVFGQADVRIAWKILSIEVESESTPMKKAADQHLWPSIARMHPSHYLASLFGAECVQAQSPMEIFRLGSDSQDSIILLYR